jgi:2-iminobutanoate/2-iminopropanoate deaminase
MSDTTNSAFDGAHRAERASDTVASVTTPVTYHNPPELFAPTGPWSVSADAGPFVFLAGMRGIDPASNTLVSGDLARTRQAFANLRQAARAAGLDLSAIVRLTVYVTDMQAHCPLVNAVQQELWGDGPYPPRSIVQVSGLNQDDFVEVEATLYRG